MDNAIEGTLQLQENERQIFFKFVLKKDNFFLMIENSCQENAVIRKGNCFLTTKKEKGHGMGILSVKRAVEDVREISVLMCRKEGFRYLLFCRNRQPIRGDEINGKNNQRIWDMYWISDTPGEDKAEYNAAGAGAEIGYFLFVL